MSLEDVSESRQGFLKDSALGVATVGTALTAGGAKPASAQTVSAWKQVPLPVASVLYDIAFDPQHPDHGLVVGAQGTFLEVGSRCSACLFLFVAIPGVLVFSILHFSDSFHA